MADYGVTRSRLYGTTVIREAANRRSILDQIYIKQVCVLTLSTCQRGILQICLAIL